ncbi:sensor histidine kinase [Nocardia altamirensis]|uniref:sensor histidine kinase n=1 Tax=Nocardia altamirensis TaxID=472158 RepID=UPI00083FF375|nr:histidine kinase [Nocardia altamirensis]
MTTPWYRVLLYLLPIPLSVLDVWLVPQMPTSLPEHLSAAFGVVALLWRRRFPVLTFLCTIPAAWHSLLIPSVAIYTVGRHSKRSLTVVVCTIILAVVFIVVRYSVAWEHIPLDMFTVIIITRVLSAIAPAVLGRLLRSRVALQDKIAELTAAREEGDALRIQSALARDRAELASEMHDVVSHQVSMIAIQAGALEVSSPDPKTVGVAETIRELSAKTLDELRHMVTVLRASGTNGGALTPQPTVADLPKLLHDSGIDVTLIGAMPDDLGAATQRAIYRTVQEALTNVRKHAPGAAVTVTLTADTTEVTVIVRNTAGQHTPMTLPSAGHGLRGLTERAELLDGTLRTHHEADGGFRLELRIPRSADARP